MTTLLNPFHDSDPFVSPSLNRVRVFEVPGERVPPDGVFGYALLGYRAVRGLVEARAADLRLALDEDGMLRRFDGCFVAGDAVVRDTAVAIARQVGRRMAALLTTLLTAEPRSRAVRPEWTDAHWRYWQSIQNVWLGGGLMAGHMGVIAAETTTGLLHGRGLTQLTVRRADDAATLPLRGAASLVGPGVTAVPVLDFGQTAIKRALAQLDDGRVAALEPLPDVPTGAASLARPAQDLGEIAALANRLVDLMARTYRTCAAAGFPVGTEMAAAMACYLRRGQPPPDEMSFYGRLQRLTDNVAGFLETRVAAELGRPVRLHLVHDGTAAAQVFAGQPHTAVITLGTALGIGFPPAA